MIKMILADDESIVREGLRNIINWEEYGIEIVAEASDGQEAYDLCSKLLPDILFTDIRMPHMDGLEVATKLKENGITLKVIIFSGIQDFDYAKSALNINAEGYILKPLDVDELTGVVNKVVKQIDNERNMAERVQQLRLQLNENLGAAREKFLRFLILGMYKKEREIIDKLTYFKDPLKSDEPVSVAVLQIDDYSKKIEQYLEEDKQLLSFSVSNIVEEVMNQHSNGICVVMGENEYVLLMNCKKSKVLEENEIYQEIITCLDKYLDISVSIGVGRIVESLLAVNSAYKDAGNALYFKFYTGKGSIINAADISLNFDKNEFPDLYAEEAELVNLIKSGNVEKTEKTIQELFHSISLHKKYTIAYIQRICDEIIYMISRAIYELGEDIGEIAGNRTDIVDSIYRTESIFDLQEQVSTLLIKIAGYFSRKYTQKNSKVVADIKRLIERKYMEDISINKIAESVYLSPNYISVIFKQETGETIIDYLTKTRMEEAKVLLRETDFKILDISEMVGFQDASYFGKVFKKYTGIHPQKYRTFGNSTQIEE